jgi:hypothetical protein
MDASIDTGEKVEAELQVEFRGLVLTKREAIPGLLAMRRVLAADLCQTVPFSSAASRAQERQGVRQPFHLGRCEQPSDDTEEGSAGPFR